MTEEKLKAEEKAATAQALLTAGAGFTPPLRAGAGFTIQVASFQDKARAELVSEELKKKGYIPVISAKDLGDKGTWYRVWVGDFESEEKARELLKRLKEDYKDSFIKLR
jgi:cell division septation protein DedD